MAKYQNDRGIYCLCHLPLNVSKMLTAKLSMDFCQLFNTVLISGSIFCDIVNKRAATPNKNILIEAQDNLEVYCKNYRINSATKIMKIYINMQLSCNCVRNESTAPNKLTDFTQKQMAAKLRSMTSSNFRLHFVDNYRAYNRNVISFVLFYFFSVYMRKRTYFCRWKYHNYVPIAPAI